MSIMNKMQTLEDLKPGQTARVSRLVSEGGIRKRLLDIGLVEGTKVECLLESAPGGMVAYLIRGAVIALRTEETEKIWIH